MSSARSAWTGPYYLEETSLTSFCLHNAVHSFCVVRCGNHWVVWPYNLSLRTSFRSSWCYISTVPQYISFRSKECLLPDLSGHRFVLLYCIRYLWAYVRNVDLYREQPVAHSWCDAARCIILDLRIHILFLGTTVLCSLIVALHVSASVNYILARFLKIFV